MFECTHIVFKDKMAEPEDELMSCCMVFIAVCVYLNTAITKCSTHMQYEPTIGHSLWPSTLKDCVEEPPEAPAFGILRQEGHKFQASLECVVKQGLGEKKVQLSNHIL